MLTEDLLDSILINPALEEGVDELRVLSAFISPVLISEHLGRLKEKYLSIKINLTIGWPSQLSITQKRALKRIIGENPERLKCFYYSNKSSPIHSKVYVWLKDGNPVKAFHGSANYTYPAFGTFGGTNPTQENTMAECSATEAMRYINFFDPQYELVTDAWFEASESDSHTSSDAQEHALSNSDTIVVSLLTANGEMHKAGGGLNWGMPTGTARRPFRPEGFRQGYDEAYIPYPRKLYNLSSDFFPPLKEQFLVETDDNEAFIFVMAHPKLKGGSIPGGIETPESNAELGRYFRQRLGIPYGEMVTKEHLTSYGRTDVVFTKIDDKERIFHLDFSKPNDN